MLARHVRLLRRCFQAAAIAAGAPALVAHCGTTPVVPIDGHDGSADADGAGPLADAAPLDAATTDADAAADVFDASACWATVSVSDAMGPDAEELCDFFLPCGLSHNGLTTVGCSVVPAGPDGGPIDPASVGFPTCYVVAGQGCDDAGYAPIDAAVLMECVGCPGGGGRRPPGYVREPARATTRAGAYFAELAAIEAASVRAFVDLARALEASGAPAELVRGATEAARDEVRHARAMARLARRFGGRARAPRVRKVGFGSLAALARHNAVEGCVRETHGALLNAWQAAHARDPTVRNTMHAVAEDELRHAALSWAIAEWAASRLSPRERRKAEAAQRRALGRLVASASHDAPRDLSDAAGLPSARQCEALARAVAGYALA